MPVSAFRINANLLGVFSSHSFRVHALLSFTHTLRRLRAAIVKAAKPVIPRHFWAAIIALEVAVMKLVVKRSNF